jgi:hypothetical protein
VVALYPDTAGHRARADRLRGDERREFLRVEVLADDDAVAEQDVVDRLRAAERA